MNVRDIFSFSFSAIKLRKLRASLTIVGVVIGIAAVVALLSITQGLQTSIAGQLQTGFATDTLIVSTGGGFGGGFGSGHGGGTDGGSNFELLVNHTQIIDELDDVVMSVAVIEMPGYIESGDQELWITVVGVEFDKYATVYSSTFVAESGSIPKNPEYDTVVLGKRVNDPMEDSSIFSNVGDVVEIVWINASTLPPQNETYSGDVVAVIGEIGGFGIGGPSDQSVYIPITQAQSFFGTNECDMIIVQLVDDSETTIDNVSEAIEEAFSDQVSVSSSTAVLTTVTSIFSTVELFLAGIAAISLVVAGIGIMNIMIVSLMERTREIGILKAMGMKSRTVLSIFLSEAVIVGVIGAVIGIATGWGLANVVVGVMSGGGFMPVGGRAAATSGMTITPVLTPTVLLGAFVFGMIISVIFAIYPAWRASRLRPIEALRYE